MSIAEKLTAIAENQQKVYDAGYAKGKTEGGYNDGYSDGQQAEHDRFWDLFQDYGNRDHYYYAFSYYNFDDSTYNPKYPIRTGTTTTGSQCLFYSSYGITDTKVDIYVEGNTTTRMFISAKKLKTIRKLIVHENVSFTNTFDSTSDLENVTFEGVIGNDIDFADCSKLTRASIESVVNHLSSETSGKSVTFSQVAKEAAFTAEEWTALTNTKSNWTIALA